MPQPLPESAGTPTPTATVGGDDIPLNTATPDPAVTPDHGTPTPLPTATPSPVDTPPAPSDTPPPTDDG
jgi:hypothetical protein